MFVAVSQFEVANHMTSEVKEAFRRRPQLVEKANGFERLDVISPRENPDEIWLITYWRDEASFREWHRGHSYRHSHQGIPKGLKLNPQRTRLLFFEHVSS